MGRVVVANPTLVKKQGMKPANVLGAEDYIFQLAMANSMMCVHNPKNAGI